MFTKYYPAYTVPATQSTKDYPPYTFPVTRNSYIRSAALYPRCLDQLDQPDWRTDDQVLCWLSTPRPCRISTHRRRIMRERTLYPLHRRGRRYNWEDFCLFVGRLFDVSLGRRFGVDVQPWLLVFTAGMIAHLKKEKRFPTHYPTALSYPCMGITIYIHYLDKDSHIFHSTRCSGIYI